MPQTIVYVGSLLLIGVTWFRSRHLSILVLGGPLLLLAIAGLNLPQQNAEDYRMGGIPLGYLPTMLLGLAVILQFLFIKIRHADWTGLNPFSLKETLLIVAFSLLTGVVSWQTSHSLNFLPYLFGFIFHWVLYRVLTLRQVTDESSLKGVAITIFVLVLLCLVRDVIGVGAKGWNFIPFLNRNATGFILVSLLPFAFLQTTFKKWLPLTALFTLIYLNNSRGGFLGTLIVCGLFSWHWRRERNHIVNMGVSFFLSVLLVVTLNQIFPRSKKSIIERFERVTQHAQEGFKPTPAGVEVDADSMRWQHYQEAAIVIRKRWLLGTGLGSKNYLSHHDFIHP